MVRFHSPLPFFQLRNAEKATEKMAKSQVCVKFVQNNLEMLWPSLFLNHPIQFLNQLKITKNHYQIHIDACIFHKVQYFSSIVVR